MKLMTDCWRPGVGIVFPLIRASQWQDRIPFVCVWWLAGGLRGSRRAWCSLLRSRVLIASLAIAAGDFQRGPAARGIHSRQSRRLDLFAVHIRLGCMEGRTCWSLLSVLDRDPGPFGA